MCHCYNVGGLGKHVTCCTSLQIRAAIFTVNHSPVVVDFGNQALPTLDGNYTTRICQPKSNIGWKRCRHNGTQPYWPAVQCRPPDRRSSRPGGGRLPTCLARPPAGSVTDDNDDRHQRKKQYWSIRRASIKLITMVPSDTSRIHIIDMRFLDCYWWHG